MKRLHLLVALLLLAPSLASAQVGSATDILTGRVTGPEGRPIDGAEVAATSIETQITRRKRTDADGRYTILFPDGGGQYQIVVRGIGLNLVRRNIARQADEDRLVTDVQLGVAVTQLAQVQVRATQTNRGRFEPISPGASERVISGDQQARLPVDAGDMAALAALAPGVVPVSGSDSTAASFSVAGQRSSLNNTTLDGLAFGSFTVPQEAVRATRVVTSTYDVARGKFTGGEIASTTRAGTNRTQGTFTYSRRDPTLEFEGSDSATLNPTFLQDQISGGLGGPIVKDRLFVFGSAQYRRRSDPFQSLLSASPSALSTIGVQPDSVASFRGTASAFGIPESGAFLPDRRVAGSTTALLRLDYFLNDGNTLTLRGDYRRQSQDPARISPLAFPSSGGTSTSNGAGVAATLSSRFESGIINEFRSYLSGDSRRSEGFVALPAGRVRISSALPGGSQGVSVLSFGGNPSFPQNGSNRLLELTDEVSYLTRNAKHRVKLGGLLDVNSYSQDVTTNRLGTFTFNSLSDFASGVPESYTRTRGFQQRDGRSTQSAIYIGDTFRAGGGLQLVFGLRGEASRFGVRPQYNAQVDSLFRRNTASFPSELHVSPRIGFSWNLSRPDPNDPFSQFMPAFVIRGGVGEFRAVTPTGLYTSAQGATGLMDTDATLTCIGAAAPTPDWALYAANPSAIPTACAADAGTQPAFASVRRNVTVFDPGFQAPRAWRSSLGAQHRVFGRFTVSADASYARGVSLYGVTDLNLNSTPAFSLANEASRPVYAPAGSIVPSTGAVSYLGSRIQPAYGQVLELASNLRSDTRQLTLGLNGGTSRGTLMQLSYTYTRSRDQSSFNCCSAQQGFASPTTAGNPNVREWAPSDLEQRHIMQAIITRPIVSFLEITAIAQARSGVRFTPVVGGDINGDGARNDRAFIFDPRSTADASVAAAMTTLLQSAPARVRECLNAQLGAVAGRNSCTGPWTPTLDVQANFRPQGLGLKGRTTFSLIAANALAGVDQLLHGSDLRGWGQINRADPTLLYVRGFDPASRSFRYEVNGRFGNTSSANRAFRSPFVIALQARMTVGPDPRDRFRAIFSGNRAGAATPGAAAPSPIPNPIAQIIAMADTLALSKAQIASLTLLSDSLAAKNDSLASAIRGQVAKTGASGDPGTIFAAIRPKLVQGRANLTAALKSAEAILTPDQWSRVPESVRNPVAGFGAQRRPGAAGPRRREP